MNRTVLAILACQFTQIGTGAAQEPAPAAATRAQPDPVDELVDAMRAAEQALDSLRLTMSTMCRVRGGLDVTTSGELRVLRGTQPTVAPRTYSRVEYAFGDGLTGRLEAAQTDDGIVMFEQGPAFGAIFLRVDRSLVADLEWAGQVLRQNDLPGMPDARAMAPLGSGMIEELRRTFELAVGEQDGSEPLPGGEAGVWLRGARKPGLDQQDPDLPLADRVELFVRQRDHALLSARYFVADEVVQSITVDELEVGIDLPEGSFVVDGRGLRQSPVQLYQPMWTEIQDAIERAEAAAPEGHLRPSKLPQRGLEFSLQFFFGWWGLQ